MRRSRRRDRDDARARWRDGTGCTRCGPRSTPGPRPSTRSTTSSPAHVDTLDADWRRRLADLQAEIGTAKLAGSLARARRQPPSTFDALTGVDSCATGGRAGPRWPEPARRWRSSRRDESVLAAPGAHRSQSRAEGRVAWAHQKADPAARRFEQTLADIAGIVPDRRPVAARPIPPSSERVRRRDAMGGRADARWSGPRRRICGSRQRTRSATRPTTLRNQLAVAVTITVLAVAAALLLARQRQPTDPAAAGGGARDPRRALRSGRRSRRTAPASWRTPRRRSTRWRPRWRRSRRMRSRSPTIPTRRC